MGTTFHLAYPVRLERDDNNTILVTFADLPGATYGETAEEALAHAKDALVTMLEFYMDQRRPLPDPSGKGDAYVALDPSIAVKVLLYRRLIDTGTTKSRLAQLMGQHKSQIDRLLDLRHHTRLDQIDRAFSAIGLVICGIDAKATRDERRVFHPPKSGSAKVRHAAMRRKR